MRGRGCAGARGGGCTGEDAEMRMQGHKQKQELGQWHRPCGPRSENCQSLERMVLRELEEELLSHNCA